MPEESRYSVAEISLATGMKKSLIASRRRCYGIPANKAGYTEAEVVKMLRTPPDTGDVTASGPSACGPT